MGFNASISSKSLQAKISFITPMKLFFPIFSIHPFKNTHTVPNTVLQQNMQQWIISIIRCLEHIISQFTALVVGNTSIMPSLKIIHCIFKKSIQNFPYEIALCHQMHHNQSIRSNFIDKETTKVQSLRDIYFFYLCYCRKRLLKDFFCMKMSKIFSLSFRCCPLHCF